MRIPGYFNIRFQPPAPFIRITTESKSQGIKRPLHFHIDTGASVTVLLDRDIFLTGKRTEISFSNWRPSDQRVYISNTSKAKQKLGWSPKVSPEEGVKKLVDWAVENKDLF